MSESRMTMTPPPNTTCHRLFEKEISSSKLQGNMTKYLNLSTLILFFQHLPFVTNASTLQLIAKSLHKVFLKQQKIGLMA